jgi:hypothetical protein
LQPVIKEKKINTRKKRSSEMFGRIDHIGHVVRDFDKAMDLYKNKFGLTPKRTMDFPEFGSRMAFFSLDDL